MLNAMLGGSLQGCTMGEWIRLRIIGPFKQLVIHSFIIHLFSQFSPFRSHLSPGDCLSLPRPEAPDSLFCCSSVPALAQCLACSRYLITAC